jgi:hypothetical protein
MLRLLVEPHVLGAGFFSIEVSIAVVVAAMRRPKMTEVAAARR